MSTTTIPPALYKYLAPDRSRASQILGNLRIRFSQVSVLNDVDEFQPPYKGVAPRAETERTVRERFPKQYPTEHAAVYAKRGPVGAEQWIEQMEPIWADKVEQNYDITVREVYAKLDSNFGLLSLSETVTSKLMWSFYSDGGRGFVVEFDPSDAWFNCKTADNDSYRHLRQVRYVSDREPMYIASKDDAGTRDDAVLYTKTSEWEFEKEWRIIRGFKEAEKVGPDDYSKDVWLFEIPPSAIKAVVFGYRAPPQLEASLREIVTTNVNLKHIVFRQAVRDVNGHIEVVSSLPDAH
jgi:hypothetical protein